MSARLPANFVADSVGLDFLNSVASPAGAPVDWIDDGGGFVEWLREADLVPSAVLYEVAGRAMPGELDRVADQARGLREWFRGFVNVHMGKPLGPDALKKLDPINRLLERDERYGQLVIGADEHLAFTSTRRWRSPESLLLPIGEALAEVVAREDFRHVKACEGAACTLIFADHTRAHARRWCSMSVCGNRAKVAAHRDRAATKRNR